MIRRTRLGARSRARVKQGGKLAQGRPSVSLARWREIVAEVKGRAGGYCEVAFGPEQPCPFLGAHPHHLIKRSAGGSDDAANVVWICPRCHQMTDAPYATGRLMLRREVRVFGCIVTAPDKFAVRGQG